MEGVEIKLLSMDFTDPLESRSVRARAAIMIGPIEIRDVRIIENEGSPARVRMPSYKLYANDERTRYEWVPYVVLTRQLKLEVDRLVLGEYEKKRV